MSETMRALRFHNWQTSPSLDEVERPIRVDGETLVSIRAGAVGHLDTTLASGKFGVRPDLPYIAGVEGSGIVLESDELAVGTLVMLRGAGIGMMRDGTWAEQISVPNRAAIPIAEELPPELAATYFVPATTAWTVLHDIAHIDSGENVIVAGAAGAVGSMLVQLALRAGANVTGLVATEGQRDAVTTDATIIMAHDTEAIEKLAADRTASLLVDTIGGSDLGKRSRWVGVGGRVVLIGYVAGTSATLDLPNWLLDDVALLPVNMMRRQKSARACAPKMAQMLARGDLHLAVESYSFSDSADVLAKLETGGLHGRAVFIP